MKKALVTLAVGKRFARMVKEFCHTNWKMYAEKYNYDLIIIEDLLDNTEFGKSRCAAWQKCLVLSQEWSQKYDKIVWLDTDIIINPNSPDICEGVPNDKIGAVDEFSFPTKADYNTALSRMYKHWDNLGYNPSINFSAQAYYKNFGIDCNFEEVVQTGVMVFNPKIHKEVMEHVYYNYEEKGLNYEMRPLSYEIIKNNYHHWIDHRFNMHIQFLKALYYPFLLQLDISKPSVLCKREIKKLCIESMFANSYFLHFTGATEEMKILNWKKIINRSLEWEEK